MRYINFSQLFAVKSYSLMLLAMLIFSNHLYASNKIFTSDKGSISASIHSQLAYFTQSNSWFGKSQANIGLNSTNWLEGAIEPGLKANLQLPTAGEVFGELSYRYAKTFNDDPSGFTRTLNNPGKGLLEQGFIGWRSGDTFAPAKDYLTLSIGQQDYTLDKAFLLLSSGSAGYKNGAYWLGGRRAFTDSALLKLQTDDYLIESFRLKSRPQAGSKKDIRGVNLEWTKKRQQIVGVSYLKVYQDNNASLDGANIFDIRLSFSPLPSIPQFKFLAEYVKQDNGQDLDARAWYTDLSYQYSQAWKPEISYRYASFQGDDPNTSDNEAYNMLSYGISDWGTWFQGEILGQYVFLGKSNLNSHRLRVKVKPALNWTVALSYYRFLSDQPASRGITSKHFADEVDLIINHRLTKTASIHAVLALSKPGNGATEMTGGTENWMLAMIYGSIKF